MACTLQQSSGNQRIAAYSRTPIAIAPAKIAQLPIVLAKHAPPRLLSAPSAWLAQIPDHCDRNPWRGCGAALGEGLPPPMIRDLRAGRAVQAFGTGALRDPAIGCLALRGYRDAHSGRACFSDLRG